MSESQDGTTTPPTTTRCGTVIDDPTEPCRKIATHILSYSLRDPETDEREHFDGPTCEPCGKGFCRRPALKATMRPMEPEMPAPTLEYLTQGP